MAEGMSEGTSEVQGQGKKRHGCLTAWLILMIVANSVVALLYLVANAAIREQFPKIPGWVFVLMGLMALLNVVFAVALFAWKKWGFYGFVVSSVVAFVINVTSGINVVQAVLGLLGIAILYGILQIGKENKGWPQLE